MVSCPCPSQFTCSASLSQHLGFISYSVDKVGALRESKPVALGFMKPILPIHQSHVTKWGKGLKKKNFPNFCIACRMRFLSRDNTFFKDICQLKKSLATNEWNQNMQF